MDAPRGHSAKSGRLSYMVRLCNSRRMTSLQPQPRRTLPDRAQAHRFYKVPTHGNWVTFETFVGFCRPQPSRRQPRPGSYWTMAAATSRSVQCSGSGSSHWVMRSVFSAASDMAMT